MSNHAGLPFSQSLVTSTPTTENLLQRIGLQCEANGVSAASRLFALLVGEDPSLCREITGYLETQAIRSKTAPNGKEALALAQQEPPDLLIIDLDLPGEQGLSTLRDLKTNLGLERVPAIVLSGTDRAEEISRTFSTDACEFMTKPLRAESFIDRLNAVIKTAATPDEPTSASPPVPPDKVAAGEAVHATMELVASLQEPVSNLLREHVEILRQLSRLSLRAEEADAVQKLKETTHALVKDLEHLFGFARVELGVLPLRNGVADLADAVAGVCDSLEEEAAEVEAKFKCTLPSTLPTAVEADGDRLTQSLIDLGTALLRVGAKPQVDLSIGGQERAASSDSAPGTATAPRIFDLKLRFRHTAENLAPKQRAALAGCFKPLRTHLVEELGKRALVVVLAKRVIELMEGTIRIVESEGKTIVVEVTLPLPISSKPAPIAPEMAKRPLKEETAFSARYPLRLLLVEDNPVNQDVTSKMLERMGYAPKVATNGMEALAALDQIPYDLVFMDLQMPGLDGYETARRIISKFPAGHRPTILALTAHSIHEEGKKCLEAGMDDFISKPLDMGMLRTLIEHWAEVRSGKRKPVNRLGVKIAPPSGEKPAPVATARLVDLDRLMHFTGGNIKSVRDLLDFYFRQSVQHLEQIRHGLDKGSPGDVRRAAHTLVGSSGTCGMETVVALLKEIERVSSAGQLEPVAQLYQKTLQEIDHVKAYLKEQLPETPSGK